jgi:branched-chain amino acid aminotransferase
MYSNANFPKSLQYWYNGSFHDWSEGLLHPMTHALHYGTSVFEGIRAYSTAKGPAVFRLPEHIDRFLHSASVLCMQVPYTKDEIINLAKATMLKNKLASGYIRPVLFYAFGNLGLVPKSCPVELAIGAWEWGAYLGKSAIKGASVFIVPWRRLHHTQIDMKAKVGGIYAQSTLNGIEARAKGFDEAVFLNLEGRIAEGPGENIFIINGKTLRTNSVSESILEGITRMSVLEFAKDAGYKTEVSPITKEDLFTADEAFFSGTAVEISPIIRVTDGSDAKAPAKEHIIGKGEPGPVTLDIRRNFMDIVGGKSKKFEKWLTYINQ